MNDSANNTSSASMHLSPERLRSFFISHLNKIYSAKCHLEERLPELQDQSHFADVKNAIGETLDDITRQIVRMDEIYTILEVGPSVGNGSGLVGMVEDAYMTIHEQSADLVLRDLSVLFYMLNIESVELASFQILQIAAEKLNNKQIKLLLLENFDEAKADRALLLLITKKYMTS